MTLRLRVAGLRSALAGPFDLELAAGEALAVTGPSGAGKSLFLRMIADLDANEGEAWVDGVARSSLPAPQWRRRVVYCPAESGWWADKVAAHFADIAAARTLANRLGLKPELLDGPVLRLSTGERQRLALVRAIAMAPPVLLLDEPTGPLDPESGLRTEAVLRERLADGLSAVVVTHDLGLPGRIGARHLAMEHGRLVALAPAVVP